LKEKEEEVSEFEEDEKDLFENPLRKKKNLQKMSKSKFTEEKNNSQKEIKLNEEENEDSDTDEEIDNKRKKKRIKKMIL